jgi:hypothetical protein
VIPRVTLALRLLLGAVFVYAAYTKLRQSWLLFALSIDSYQLLPEWAVYAVARTLPAAELESIAAVSESASRCLQRRSLVTAFSCLRRSRWFPSPGNVVNFPHEDAHVHTALARWVSGTRVLARCRAAWLGPDRRPHSYPRLVGLSNARGHG